MSSTRRASKRDRLARRAENDQMRTARRDSLAVLLSRAQRGVPLTADEAALLRAAVEAEIRESDAARQAERGQQRAADRERERVTAAEAAIVEAEQRAAQAETERDSIDLEAGAAHIQLAAALSRPRDTPREDLAAIAAEWKQRAEQAEDLLRIAHETSNETEQQRAAAEQRAEQAEVRLARIRDMADAWPRRLPAVIRTATAAEAVRNAANGDDRPFMFAVTAEQAEQRAEMIAADRDRLAAELDAAEQRATDLLQRAERAEQDRAALAMELQATRDRAAQAEAELTRSENARETLRDRVAQAEELQRIAHETSNAAERVRDEAEQRLAAQHDAHDARRRLFADALSVDDTTTWPRLLDIARTAAHLAQRAANTEAGDTAALRLAESSTRQWKARAQEAEKAAKAWEHTARRYANSLDAERDRADAIRRYVEAAYAADMSDGVREDLRRLLDGKPPTYGAPWTPERTPEQPEPCQHTPGNDSECPCPPACGCCAVAPPEKSKPGAVEDCPHCPDGHTPPTSGSQPWAAWVGPERDGDGQPLTIHVARSAGAHVAESDAAWVRARLNDQEQPR